MKERIVIGEDVITLLSQLQITKVDWLLPRLSSKNLSTKISGIILAGLFTNQVLGKALASNFNLVVVQEKLTLDQFSNNLLPEKYMEAVDIMYKHDIFVLSMHQSWMFQTPTGNKILANLFGNDRFLVSTLPIPDDHILIQLSKYTTVAGALQRFHHPILLNFSSTSPDLNNILFVPNLTKYIVTALSQQSINLVVTCNLTSSVVIMAERFGIKVVWINAKEVLSEVARELYYALSRYALVNLEYV